MRRLIVPSMIAVYVAAAWLFAAPAKANDYTGTAPTVTAQPITESAKALATTGAGHTLGLLFTAFLVVALGTVILGEGYRRKGQGYGAYGKFRKPGRKARWL